ncbi:MAG: class II aldolase/adducin family protein [Alphaproteobacteria bacterium]|nr:class II aldolase/adducin family protein [Alphaproteobacteria bacterium]
MKDRVSPEEWRMRVDLAACYRLAARYGWVDLIGTHISARVAAPDGQHHFLINPHGLLFQQVTASNLVKIDQDGRKLQESPYAANPAGFVIHSAIHMRHEEAICVFHSHTVAGMGVSMQEEGLLMASQHAAFFFGNLGYHDIEHMESGIEGRDILANDLGVHRALIMRNHGLLTTGRTVAEAFQIMHTLERACSAQIAAQSGGSRVRRMSDKTCAWFGEFARKATLERSDMAWRSLLATLEESEPGYKD